ncbi:hypothetical protein [Acidithiobacillus ferridurans]|uniref:Uncharacterized protein n=1 Tax=Acidithiobacillus ferridurans TaxID=1232575 RepID=A0A8X8G898_ACIFI|nr:hypothetical protein [Acidithiobacillus ferridurans]MBU2717294.1 hypothetical protein [Acidithiobacillus ferridurans]MBU2721819.1 hypothetical protein [Acidithiobacillus ferridurans]MBU2726332.1 hypothetical protein [Acidithiobacillus ferridurans]
MSVIHTLIYGGLTLGVLSMVAAWLSGREPEPEGLFAMLWKVMAAAFSISGLLTWVMVPVDLHIVHTQVSDLHFILFTATLVMLLLWSMSRIIVLKLELS